MRMLGKENEDLQQHIRELSEALKSSHESKSILVANHEVWLLLAKRLFPRHHFILFFTASNQLKDRGDFIPAGRNGPPQTKPGGTA